jgi:hypothetical protein
MVAWCGVAWRGVSSSHRSQRLRLLAGYNNSMRNSSSKPFCTRNRRDRDDRRGATEVNKDER